MIVNGRTLVPARAIVEALNGQISWNEKTQQVDINLNGHTMISLRINESVMYVKRPNAALEMKKNLTSRCMFRHK